MASITWQQSTETLRATEMLLFSHIISGSLAPMGSFYPAGLCSHPYGRVPAVAELSISRCSIQTETPKGRSSFLFLWLKGLAPLLEELNSFLVQLLIYISGKCSVS